MLCHQYPYACASGKNHVPVPGGDLALPDRKCLSQLRQIWTEWRLEKKYGIKSLPRYAVNSDQYLAPGENPSNLLLVPDDFRPPATLGPAVEESSFYAAVSSLELMVVGKECPVSRQKLGVCPAPFIHEFPEHPIRYCLPYPGDLGKTHAEVMEGKQAGGVG